MNRPQNLLLCCLLALNLQTVWAQAAGEQKKPGDVRTQQARKTAPVDPASQKNIVMPVLEIVGTRNKLNGLPGAASVVDNKTLRDSRVFTANEALRKVPGVVTRDEEGFGLRPNISIRGINPTRSQKILLLEDGVPLTFAPYGGNESYYHPPVDRFDRIEVLKGAAMNVYGPQSLVGTVNYITPTPPQDFAGEFSSRFGSRKFFSNHLSLGQRGLLFDLIHKVGDGARDNVNHQTWDANLKGVFALADAHTLTARINVYNESSLVTYSGITDAEARNFGLRYNPFTNDTFDIGRQGIVFAHEWTPNADLSVLTNLYYNHTARDWWRQSSSTADAQCNASVPTFSADRAAGIAVNVNACNSRQGRLREYGTSGIEPRLTYQHGLFGADNELLIAGRLYYETQDRQQKNGTTPTARDGVLGEDNERRASALMLAVQNRFDFGALALTPSVRVENINYDRRDLRTGAQGDDSLNEVIPALGLTYTMSDHAVLFGGVHRGFSPPRVEDLINGTGGSVELGSEDSLNAEVGVRANLLPGLKAEAALFRNDFHRQIAVGNVAGGGIPQVAIGETLYEGLELASRADFGALASLPLNPFLELALTYIPTAKQVSPVRRVDTGAVVGGSAAGLRLPYAPRFTSTTTFGVQPLHDLELRLEVVYVGSQFSDFAETVAPPAGGTGQSGRINDHTLVNLAGNYTIRPLDLTVFLAAKNATDEQYIADRVRGILPGAPVLVQGGFEYRFY